MSESVRGVQFSTAEEAGNRLLLTGDDYAASVEAVSEGIWRVYLRPVGHSPSKASWVVREANALAVDCTVGEDAVSLDGAGDRLTIQLAPFSLAIGRSAGMAGAVLDDGHLGLRLPHGARRRYFGLGERTGFLDKRGRRWVNSATDQTSHRPSADPLYQAHPFLMVKDDAQTVGLYLDETWRTVFELGHPREAVLRTDGPTLDLYLIAGPSPKQVIERYTALVGRAPLPPLWALGYHQCRWSYTSEEEVEGVVETFRRQGIPLDAIWLDIDYMDGFRVFTFDPKRFPHCRELVQSLAKRSVRTVAIVDPGVKHDPGWEIYERGVTLDAYVRRADGEPFVGGAWPGASLWPDFTRDEIRAWWGSLHRFYLDHGIRGIWNDMNEPSVHGFKEEDAEGTIPADARQAGGSHAEVHNLYGQLMSRATHEGLLALRPLERPFVLTRSGFAGIQRHAWVWTGDNDSSWEHLESSIPMLLNLGVSGVPFFGADIGGFAGDTSGELLTRWTWLGAFYPLMRNHSCRDTVRQEPWAFGEPYLSAIREAISFRYRLLPYLYTLVWEATETGLPPMRPMMMGYPEDPSAESLCDQFLLGEALLVAPALRPDQSHRMVYLPHGLWRDFWSGACHEGPARIVVETPLDRIPLFLRGGSAIPMAPCACHTGDAYWRSLQWHVSLGSDQGASGLVYEDAGDGYQPGRTSRLTALSTEGMLCCQFADMASSTREQVRVRVSGAGIPTACSTNWRHAKEGLWIELDGKGSAQARW